jgi:peptidoglycan/xylan/chitin deacetylase (PgdA/CDA1 family)
MNLRFPLTALHYHALTAFSTSRLPLGSSAPVVSFTFDDFPQSAATVGGAILKRFGVRGTYYTAVGLMNRCNPLGQQFGPDDLHQLIADKHEVANHTFTHISSSSVPSSAFREDVRKGRAAIQAITGVADSGNFAYPFGTVTLKAHKALSSLVTSCRTTFPGINGPVVETRLLRANALVGDLDRAAEARQLILEAEARRHWLIFYTHDVRSMPSPFGCTPGLLELTVEFALHRGCRILTVCQALSLTPKPLASVPSDTTRSEAALEGVTTHSH